MIIELVGLPAVGKTHIAQQLEQRGYVCVDVTRFEILWRSFVYAVAHPAKVFRHGVFLFSNLSSYSIGYLKFMNLFLRAYAIQQKAEKVPRAVVDQGLYQNALSLFTKIPSKEVVRSLIKLFPRNVLWCVEIPESIRSERLQSRGVLPREEYGEREAEVLSNVSLATYPVLKEVLNEESRTFYEINGEEELGETLHRNISYITFARMPTEKAHGASIAHMCSSFTEAGFVTKLVVPKRKNKNITDTVHKYYGLDESFKILYLNIPDILSWCTNQICFFVQRLLFVFASKKEQVDTMVYSRDPEIIHTFAKERIAIFEAHRLPEGRKGRATASLVKNAALVVCNSKGTEEAFKEQGITRTVVAPNGFDVKSFEQEYSKEISRENLGISKDATVAMYVGSLELWKGVKTLFDASEEIAKGGVDLVVIGGSDTEVLKLKKEYPNVMFVGFKPYKDLAKNLAAADMLVLPNTAKDLQSISFTSPIKLFGYMAAGAPIVASDIPSVREILDESSGILVAPDDPKALAEGILKLSKDGKKMSSFGEAVKEKSKNYTWAARAEIILSKLKKI